jgi:hypothetical protein
MIAVFGKAYRSASNDAVVELPNPDNRNAVGSYVISPVATTVLPTGETVLIANAEDADDKGNPISAHASPGLLNVYFLRQEAGQWKVLRRHENIAALGSFGNIGDVVWTTLAPGKPGFGVVHGWTGQGYSLEALSLFDLADSNMHDLTGDTINIHSDNDSACGPESMECWNITGEWRLLPGKAGTTYNDLIVEFSGEKTYAPQNGLQDGPREGGRVSKKILSSARYVFDGKRYQLVSGVNEAPDV